MLYCNRLSQLILEGKLQDLNDSSWGDLIHLVTPRVLEEAHKKQNEIKKIFKPLHLVGRSVKKYSRVQEKNQTKHKYQHDFKVNCDFIAYRIPVTEPSNIMAVVNQIIAILKVQGGDGILRNSIMNDNREMTDIISYVYGYLPQYGFMIEFQIGSPFAMYTFMVDSMIRDGAMNLTDVWKNNFYGNMKDFILGKNKDFPVTKEVQKLYGSHPVPKEFRRVINLYTSI